MTAALVGLLIVSGGCICVLAAYLLVGRRVDPSPADEFTRMALAAEQADTKS